MAWSNTPRDWSAIPDHLRTALKRYVDEGRIPGDLLVGILSNDLTITVNSCDAKLWACVPAIFDWVQIYLPALCHGSGEALQRWEEHGGLLGLVRIVENHQREEEEK